MSTRPASARWHEPHAASALFYDTETVDETVTRLIRAGMPRDLIDVVVAPEAAQKYYKGRTQPRGREAMRFAGIGGLVGLIIGAFISLVLVSLPGFADPGLLAIVQLIGPNFATVTGATIGLVIGFFVHRGNEHRHARAAEAPNAIVIVVTARSREEGERLARLLADSGGKAPRLEA